jgi:L-aspartate oxidase
LVDLVVDGSASSTRRCQGFYAFNSESQEVETWQTPHTVFATGGAGKVYIYTTNPDSATGDGIACAFRAGCTVSNLEFIQFHPTCLFHPHAKSFLISEAVRGEGGRLLLPNGTRFMNAHDERLELAPRDVVARAIDAEMKKHGIDCVYLDISHQSPLFLHTHFPTILARCAQLGIDITRQAIPVVPAAHYTCGGVVTDIQGHTDLNGLYAVGETACTGLHGANRLASNSLLECVVIAQSLANSLAHEAGLPPHPPALPAWDDSRVSPAAESVLISHNWDELRRCMWNFVGIVRSNERLQQANLRLAVLREEVQNFYARFCISRDLLELRNLVQVAELIVQSAQLRQESRGLHFNRDYPFLLNTSSPSYMKRN